MTAIGSGTFQGVTTVFRKELTEWLRGPKALIVGGISIAGAIFTTLIPFIAEATGEASSAGLTSMDPTTNVLVGWTGQTVAFIAILATMALVSGERDRGTLAWSLANPVSPTSVIAAKFAASFLMLTVTAVVLPLLVSIALATVVDGGLPNLATVGTFGLLFLTLPAFYVALTVGLGTAIKSTVGVAAAAFAVMFAPQILGGIVPIIGELSPTSVGVWAMASATGGHASVLTLAGWLIAMVVIVVGAKVAFDRQDF